MLIANVDANRFAGIAVCYMTHHLAEHGSKMPALKIFFTTHIFDVVVIHISYQPVHFVTTLFCISTSSMV